MMIDQLKTELRPYQLEVAEAVLRSVLAKDGLTFTVEIARQGGKNEISARLESTLLVLGAGSTQNLIKCSPTFKPQTVISLQRLKDRLNLAGWAGKWQSEMGYIIRLCDCRAIFLSADESANVVGNTAHLLLEVDEAQDVSEDKYYKEFKPMGSTTNVTNVLYGTTWDENTLLEKTKQLNLELERKDGIKRHFRYDWQEVGKYNDLYRQYAERAMGDLGPDHPLFLTQYRLLPVRGGGGFLNTMQRSQLQGIHSRQHHPSELQAPHSKLYVAGIDLAGEAEAGEDDFLKSIKPRQDSTVITIGELEFPSCHPGGAKPLHILGDEESGGGVPFTPEIQFVGAGFEPARLPYPETRSWKLGTGNLKIVEHYSWTGRKHPDLYPQMIDLIKNVWHCRAVVVDNTGIGQPVASFLRSALGSRILPFTFTPGSKTELGFNLLAAINSGSLKMYAADSSPEYQEFWHQIEKAKSFYRPSRTMNFFLDPADGHDDYLMSLALVVEAARQYTPRSARGSG
jgi:hypothetical protein